MALKIFCTKCGARLDKPGALVFSPPSHGPEVVAKFHVCAKCWKGLINWLYGIKVVRK